MGWKLKQWLAYGDWLESGIKEISGVTEMFYILFGPVVTWGYTYENPLNYVYLRSMHFTAAKFYPILKTI